MKWWGWLVLCQIVWVFWSDGQMIKQLPQNVGNPPWQWQRPQRTLSLVDLYYTLAGWMLWWAAGR